MEASNRKVLLLDDAPTFVDISVRAFKAGNIDYATAFNGIEAVDKAKTEQPALILLDIMMKGIDGFAVLNNLKRDPETKNITIWNLTTLTGPMNKQFAASLGAKE